MRISLVELGVSMKALVFKISLLIAVTGIDELLYCTVYSRSLIDVKRKCRLKQHTTIMQFQSFTTT